MTPTCSKCGQPKTIVSNPGGGKWRCRPCHKARVDDWKAANPDRVKAHSRKYDATKRVYSKRHGLTREQFYELLAQQGGVCAICHEPQERYDIDHDHACCPGPYSCGRCVRGLLCGADNKMLGHARDSVGRLRAAVSYLGG